MTVAWWAKVDVSPLFETAMIRRGELWRLLTSIFPHVGFLHLVFNIYWLWVFGSIIEHEYGHFRTAALMVLLALGSSSLEFAFGVGGVGLSGVGYGFFGFLWVLSRNDDRFRDAMDQRKVQVFVLWFFFCIVTTSMNIFAVGNIAHGAGAILGAAVSWPDNRSVVVTSIGAILLFGLWGSTVGRPRVNLSGKAGYEEARWGYDALTANRNRDAVRWLNDAVVYQPKSAVVWYDLAIAYQRLGNKAGAKSAYQQAHLLEPEKAEYSEASKAFD